MDPLVIFDCATVLPNRFALTMAAAARSRALHRGAKPRLDKATANTGDLVLREIAEGVFTPAEFGVLLGRPNGMTPLQSGSHQELRGSAPSESATAPVSFFRETIIDDAHKRTRRNERC